MGEIAERLQMNPPTLTKLVDRMVGKSLVQRAADPKTAAASSSTPTDAGLALLHELQGKVDQHHAALQALLGDRNARQLERLADDADRSGGTTDRVSLRRAPPAR